MAAVRFVTDAFGLTSSSAAAAPGPNTDAKSQTAVWPTKRVGTPASKPETPASLVAMLVDRSGSMASMGPEVAGGCNAFLDEQRKGDADTGIPTHLLFATFDNQYELVRNAPLADQSAISADEIAPRGPTALYDAIGRCLDDASTACNARTLSFAKVVVFILTDGQENASKHSKKKDITARIKRLEAEFGWEFYFAAANQDAMITGGDLGFKGEQCLSYDAATPGACEAAFRSTSGKVNAVRTGDTVNATYSQTERNACM